MASTNGALPPTLGGQAVVEGVMIRGPKGLAVCVRNPDGEIVCRTHRSEAGASVRGLPVLRGIAAIGDTLSQGMRAMVWSAQVAAGQEPDEPDERQLKLTTALAVAVMGGLFLIAPAIATRRIERVAGRSRFASAIEGLTRIGTLVGYLRTVGRLPQAQRLFEYHGAEHRAIQAYEAGQPLEVATLYQYPNAHVRCGTSFLLTTTIISSVMYAAIGPQPPVRRLLSRLLLTPIIAGLSYEAIRLASSAPSALSQLIFRPNMALQGLTTRDPDASQMEVALAAVQAAIELHQS